MESDVVRIVLSCPGCGYDRWVRDCDGYVRCLRCGDAVSIEYMNPMLEPIPRDDHDL